MKIVVKTDDLKEISYTDKKTGEIKSFRVQSLMCFLPNGEQRLVDYPLFSKSTALETGIYDVDMEKAIVIDPRGRLSISGSFMENLAPVNTSTSPRAVKSA